MSFPQVHTGISLSRQNRVMLARPLTQKRALKEPGL